MFKKTWKRKLFLFNERFRSAILVKKEKCFFNIIIPEKYKGALNISKWLITAVGLISSLIVFPSVLYSFLFAFLLFLVGTFLEKVLFHYSPLYIQPLPDFEIENEKWLGMTYGHYLDPETEETYPMLGMFFSDEVYLRNIHRLLMEWNYGDFFDAQDNIQMSQILRENSTYTFFVYPNPDRETVKNFFQKAETERKQISLTDVQMKHFVQLVMGKGCRMTNRQKLEEFIELYKKKQFFFFELLLMRGNQPEALPDLGVFKKRRLKVKNESDLDRKDIEYGTLKLFSLREQI